MSIPDNTPDEPRRIILNTSYECNLSCDFCFSKGLLGGRPFMTPATLDKLLGHFGDTRVWRLGGPGEPLCNPHLPELAAMLREAGKEVWLITNGVDLATSMLRLECIDRLDFSVDTPTPSPRLLASLERAHEEMQGRLKLSWVVNEETIRELPDYGRLLLRYPRAEGAFNLEMPRLHEHDAFRNVVGSPAWKEMQKAKLAMPRGLKGRLIWPWFRDTKHRQGGCYFVTSIMVVEESGAVSCCCRGPNPSHRNGNALDEGQVAWHSSSMERFRDAVWSTAKPYYCDRCSEKDPGPPLGLSLG